MLERLDSWLSGDRFRLDEGLWRAWNGRLWGRDQRCASRTATTRSWRPCSAGSATARCCCASATARHGGSWPASCCRERAYRRRRGPGRRRHARSLLCWLLAAEVLALVGILWLAVAVRLTGLADHTDLSDEGIRGFNCGSWRAFKPVSEIYASQGPLSLWLFALAVAMFGPEIVVARLTVAAYSLVTLAGSVWIARQAVAACRARGQRGAGRQPAFLDNSRLAFVEVPSIAPTVLALVTLLLFRRSERRLAGGVGRADGGGRAGKPMAAVAGLPSWC